MPTASPLSADPRWARITARDRTADGTFWYSVATTGVYCRPSCPSRQANPVNVAIHGSLEEARRTGFRACRRCDPDGTGDATRRTEQVAQACRLLEGDTPPTLNTLAASLSLSPGHLHRLFKASTGLTPRAYAAAYRASRLRDGLAKASTVTAGYHAAGFGSSGRFYEQAKGLLGMKPSRYRSGGVSERLRYATGESSLGQVLVASSEQGVAAILLGDDTATLTRDLARRFPQAELIEADRAYSTTVEAVIAIVDAPRTGLSLPLDIRGTAFQQRVWTALRAIRPGDTLSYAELAAQVGLPGGSRAVAGACAANAHAVAIPCHRIVRSDGALSGYRWGVERKRTLLEREGATARPSRSSGDG